MNPQEKPVTILMADDDAEDQLMATEILAECRWPTDQRFVEHGEELMDYLLRRREYSEWARSPRPGLVLLDLNMPRKDGREALKEIKADHALRQIPIVVLTTSRNEEDIYYSYDHGLCSFITKPRTIDSLVETLNTLSRYWLQTVELPLEKSSPNP